MKLVTARDAVQRAQDIWPGAYDPEKVLDADGVTQGWTFRVQGGDTGWVLTDGTVGTQTYGYRWWAADVLLEWAPGGVRADLGPAGGTG